MLGTYWDDSFFSGSLTLSDLLPVAATVQVS